MGLLHADMGVALQVHRGASNPAARSFSMRKALMIVTSHGRLGKTLKATGLYLSEFADMVEVITRAGIEVEVASPMGGKAPIDPKSLSNEFIAYAQMVEDTRPLGTIEVSDYDAFVIAGGHGTMWDLPENAELQRILPAALEQKKVVAAVCHGPAGLVGLKKSDGKFIVAGRKVSTFTDDEETAVGLAEVMPFLLESRLRSEGARITSAPKWQANVVQDGFLVTGQNPASAKGVAMAVVRLLGNERE
jgi:putative intracellular protease/amidase